jgi:hypothetical protein
MTVIFTTMRAHCRFLLTREARVIFTKLRLWTQSSGSLIENSALPNSPSQPGGRLLVSLPCRVTPTTSPFYLVIRLGLGRASASQKIRRALVYQWLFFE